MYGLTNALEIPEKVLMYGLTNASEISETVLMYGIFRFQNRSFEVKALHLYALDFIEYSFIGE